MSLYHEPHQSFDKQSIWFFHLKFKIRTKVISVRFWYLSREIQSTNQLISPSQNEPNQTTNTATSLRWNLTLKRQLSLPGITSDNESKEFSITENGTGSQKQKFYTQIWEMWRTKVELQTDHRNYGTKRIYIERAWGSIEISPQDRVQQTTTEQNDEKPDTHRSSTSTTKQNMRIYRRKMTYKHAGFFNKDNHASRRKSTYKQIQSHGVATRIDGTRN